eukprot:COSAG06_NODE_10650_length_1642_cov_0.965651_2_plen_51_part_01
MDALRGPRCDASHSCAAGRRLAAAAIAGEHRSVSTVKQARGREIVLDLMRM